MGWTDHVPISYEVRASNQSLDSQANFSYLTMAKYSSMKCSFLNHYEIKCQPIEGIMIFLLAYSPELKP